MLHASLLLLLLGVAAAAAADAAASAKPKPMIFKYYVNAELLPNVFVPDVDSFPKTVKDGDRMCMEALPGRRLARSGGKQWNPKVQEAFESIVMSNDAEATTDLVFERDGKVASNFKSGVATHHFLFCEPDTESASWPYALLKRKEKPTQKSVEDAACAKQHPTYQTASFSSKAEAFQEDQKAVKNFLTHHKGDKLCVAIGDKIAEITDGLTGEYYTLCEKNPEKKYGSYVMVELQSEPLSVKNADTACEALFPGYGFVKRPEKAAFESLPAAAYVFGAVGSGIGPIKNGSYGDGTGNYIFCMKKAAKIETTVAPTTTTTKAPVVTTEDPTTKKTLPPTKHTETTKKTSKAPATEEPTKAPPTKPTEDTTTTTTSTTTTTTTTTTTEAPQPTPDVEPTPEQPPKTQNPEEPSTTEEQPQPEPSEEAPAPDPKDDEATTSDPQKGLHGNADKTDSSAARFFSFLPPLLIAAMLY